MAFKKKRRFVTRFTKLDDNEKNKKNIILIFFSRKRDFFDNYLNAFCYYIQIEANDTCEVGKIEIAISWRAPSERRRVFKRRALLGREVS